MTTKITVENQTGVVAIDGTTRSLPAATATGQSLIASGTAWTAQATSLSWRNRIINGDMRVAQRGTAAFSVSAAYIYTLDRWQIGNDVATAISVQQTSTAPTGFSNSLKVSTTTAINTSAAQTLQLYQPIEGFSVADLAYGSASASTVTISFWVNSSVTGTYGGAIEANVAYPSQAASSGLRSYVYTYTISAANTWEKKTITVPGFTGSTIQTNNNVGVYLVFDLGDGTNFETATPNTWLTGDYKRTSSCVKWANNANATFYLTGVQLELGSVATPFELLQYEKQLELCQRYYARLTSLSGNFVGFGAGESSTTTNANMYIKYPVRMRAAPTLVQSNTAVYNTAARAVTAVASVECGTDSMLAQITTASATQTIGQGVVLTGNNNAAAYIELNAEL